MHLSALYHYPLKSCRGNALATAQVTEGGLEADRQWMVTHPDGSFVTGREQPRLVLIEATPGAFGLRLTAPGMPAFEVDVSRFATPWQTRVWADTFDALRGDKAADDWFSDYLGIPVHLAYIGAASNRVLRTAPGIRFAFADGYPYLLISDASLTDLNGRLRVPVAMGRFRPNLVVTGCTAFAEDGWRHVRIGTVEFEVVKPCDRCVFTTIDPQTGVPDPGQQPLRTLGSYRRTDAGVMFGVNLIARTTGRLTLGDQVVPSV